MGAQSWQNPLPKIFRSESGVEMGCTAARTEQRKALGAALGSVLEHARGSFSKVIAAGDVPNLTAFSCIVATLAPADFLEELLQVRSKTI